MDSRRMTTVNSCVHLKAPCSYLIGDVDADGLLGAAAIARTICL